MFVKDKQKGIYYLDIKKHAGTDIVSRDHGRRIRKRVELMLNSKNFLISEDKLVIDFSNLSVASPSFIDEAFAKLFLRFPMYLLQNKLIFKNMTEFDRALLNDLTFARIREKESLEKTPRGRFHLAQKQRK